MMNAMTYQFFGINLVSDIALAGFPLAESSSDITVPIVWGTVVRPQDDIVGAQYKPDSVCHQDFYFLEVDDIARYYIDQGESITIERIGLSSDHDVAAFLIDTVLTALLLMHDQYVFHASAIKKDTTATMICGQAGAGKSAIALHMINMGYDFVEDDRCLPYRKSGNDSVMIHNRLPYLEVWRTEAKLLEGMHSIHKIGLVRDNIAKERIDMGGYVGNSNDDIHLQQVIILHIHNHIEPITVHRLTGAQKFSLVKQYAHKDHLIKYLGSSSQQFQFIVDLLAHIPVYLIKKNRTNTAKEVSQFMQSNILEGDTSIIRNNQDQNEDIRTAQSQSR